MFNWIKVKNFYPSKLAHARAGKSAIYRGFVPCKKYAESPAGEGRTDGNDGKNLFTFFQPVKHPARKKRGGEGAPEPLGAVSLPAEYRLKGNGAAGLPPEIHFVKFRWRACGYRPESQWNKSRKLRLPLWGTGAI
jgi:hypothetical protein